MATVAGAIMTSAILSLGYLSSMSKRQTLGAVATTPRLGPWQSPAIAAYSSAVPRHADALVVPALAANTATDIRRRAAVPEAVSTGRRQRGL
jgi:hypothetical protein